MQSMMLITSSWENRKTFKMLPITKECPYNEIIFDLDNKTLAIISKEKKQALHSVGNNKNMDKLRLVDTYYEYYIEDEEEIRNIVNMFAINKDEFDYSKYIEEAYV